MAEHSIPVDVFNPGQVFACIGIVEAADALLGDARGGFDWSNRTDASFHVEAGGSENPVEAILRFLEHATVEALAPAGSRNETSKWKIPTDELEPGEPFPYPDPASPATLPAALTSGNRTIVIDHWGDATIRDNVKFWAGAAGYPSAALAADALALLQDKLRSGVDDPFAIDAAQSSSFRLDWRRDYVPIDVGFSPNEHKAVQMIGYPLVEVLAAIGLTNARPSRVSKLEYVYGIAGAKDTLLHPMFLRAALGACNHPFQKRSFRMHLGWPGKEGQARCILNVTEETE